jgi:cytochrome c biogenesis protein
MKMLNQIWDFFASVKLAIFTLCTLAITSIIGTVIPQGESTSFYAQRFGAKSAQFMEILDIPEMYYSWWFLGLLGLLSANLIICSVERFPRVLRLIHKDNLTVDPAKLSSMKVSKTWSDKSGISADTDFSRIMKTLGWKARTREVSGGTMFFSQKGRWSRTGVYIVHLSILVIFAGAIIGHFMGYKGSVMVPELSSTNKIFASKTQQAIPLGFEVRCNRFIIEFYDNGMPKEYQSSLTILEDGKEILTKDIEVNGPLTHKGITFYQSSYQGYQDFVFHITENNSGQQKSVTIPFQEQLGWDEMNIRFGIVNAEAAGQSVVRSKIWFKAGDTPATIEWLQDGASTTIQVGDKSFTVSVKQMYATGLQVSKDPGVWVVYIGCLLMMVGLSMAFFMSHRRVWLFLPATGAQTGLILAGNTNKNSPGFRKQFDKLESSIEKLATAR